jgi:hypothetical protein
MRRDLCRKKDEGGSCATWITLDEGALRVDRFDTGSAPQRMLGGDYERWITIPPEELPKLAFALLAEKLEGKLGAVNDAEAICHAHGLKHERGSWS